MSSKGFMHSTLPLGRTIDNKKRCMMATYACGNCALELDEVVFYDEDGTCSVCGEPLTEVHDDVR